MGQGLGYGARRDPEGAEVERLDVKVGIKTGYVDDVMGLDVLLQASTPEPGRSPPMGNEFVDKAAANVRKNAGWPKTDEASMEMHYAIAKDGLLERLKDSGL